VNENMDRLKKILELERSKGYRDSAVMGGLDKFLYRISLSAPALTDLMPINYSSLDTEQRKTWISHVLNHIDSGGKKSSPKVVVSSRNFDISITSIKGINTNLKEKFNKLGVETVRDLIYFFPRRHIDYSQRRHIADLEIGIEQTVVAHVWEATEKRLPSGRRATEAIVGDESGNIRIVWFNQPYLAKLLKPDKAIVVSGKVSAFRNQRVFEAPEWEFLDSEDLTHTGRLVPIYPLTAGLSPRVVRRLVKGVLKEWLLHLPDFLPNSIKKNTGLLDLTEAIKQAHYPDNDYYRNQARKRLAFDELLLIQLSVLSKRRDWREGNVSHSLITDTGQIMHFIDSLPFTLTGAQSRSLGEIQQDLTKTKPMSRLLQGDVGSGKTIVATAAMLLAAAAGYQSALMVPTEILAEQHFQTICSLFDRTTGETGNGEHVRIYNTLLPQPVGIAALTGSLRQSVRKEVLARLSSNEIKIIIGTHALIQKGVDFHQLGLSIVDEQHRFGVMQRSELRSKGASPHVLVMSATPIPRSLALTLYGDLDLSIIDELPPGRSEIKTKWLSPVHRQNAYNFLRKQISEGRQAFIICPLIEESQAIETKAARTEYERLSKDIFPDLRLGLLHGRMSANDKEKTMQRFYSSELDILVSTPVVEVGVDVPNATVMLIEGADRFGLAQLHQFRGRVGRGIHQSYCLLLTDSPSLEAKERLSLLERTQDGFAVAEEDLRMRGPGEFFGTRQSGLPELRMAKLSDVQLLNLARKEAIDLFNKDPYLRKPEHQLLAAEVNRLWNSRGELN